MAKIDELKETAQQISKLLDNVEFAEIYHDDDGTCIDFGIFELTIDRKGKCGPVKIKL